MPDFNRIADSLKKQRPIGVTKEGQLVERNPNNDGLREDSKGFTTLKPEKFF